MLSAIPWGAWLFGVLFWLMIVLRMIARRRGNQAGAPTGIERSGGPGGWRQGWR